MLHFCEVFSINSDLFDAYNNFDHTELRPMRQKYQESLPEYEAKKREYDAQVQMIENTITSITMVS